MDILHFVFGVLGNAAALFLFLAPVITFRRILKSKSTEQFSGIPYVMTLLNCLLSAWYGLPFVSPHNILVSTINFTGATIESIYVLVYIVFAPKKMRKKMLILLSLVILVFSTVALVSIFALHGKGRKLFCGLAATIFSICMYASPLSIMRLVVTTKSVEFMPFFLSLFTFLCGTSWFIFGLLGRDPFVATELWTVAYMTLSVLIQYYGYSHIHFKLSGPYCHGEHVVCCVPNGFGCGLGTIQLILYAIYRNHNKSGGANPISDDKSVEMDFQKPDQVNNNSAAAPTQQNGHV